MARPSHPVLRRLWIAPSGPAPPHSGGQPQPDKARRNAVSPHEHRQITPKPSTHHQPSQAPPAAHLANAPDIVTPSYARSRCLGKLSEKELSAVLRRFGTAAVPGAAARGFRIATVAAAYILLCDPKMRGSIRESNPAAKRSSLRWGGERGPSPQCPPRRAHRNQARPYH